MNFKDNPYTSINYSMLGGKGQLIIGDRSYRIEIGPYRIYIRQGWGIPQDWWPREMAEPPTYIKSVSTKSANHFFNIILNALKNPEYNKGTKLLKKIHSKTFEEGKENYIVYSYKQGYMTQRVYIRFIPQSMDGKDDKKGTAYQQLPKIGQKLVVDAMRKPPVLKDMNVFN